MELKLRSCHRCGCMYKPNSAPQKYCSECARLVIKKKWRAQSKLRRAKKKRMERLKNNALSMQTIEEVVRELTAYNKKHDTHLTYGQYVGKKSVGALKD